ncbi:MAG: hypothetical protein CM15mP1_2550 [Methanobacteriota archaeon]|nr:MAG: hypothetical protein CM15mP1_2550 [Euryarchaeota archaeon]
MERELHTGDGSKYVEDSGGALSHNNVGNDWEIVWTAPESDVGDVHFSLAGNMSMEAVHQMQETIGQFLLSQFQHQKLRHRVRVWNN